ncbi:MAG: hydrolase TatD [Planctomycetes bacterium]|jgi:TatD DNase family protein|nr:hydrolase TatD [Planctomycetota bacterium]
MIDIGANLTNRAFRSDMEAVLDRAHAAGVDRLSVTGTSLDESRRASELAATRPGVLSSTAGVHPHDAKDCDNATLDALRELTRRPEVRAVGECGLDFNRNYSPPDQQRIWFERQVELAIEVQLPLFLHERDAHDAMLEILRPHRDALTKVVVHCFTGTGEELRAYLDLDLHVGITGWICDERRGGHLCPLVGDIPEDRLMIETDAPYLLPRTMRPRPKNRRNEPAFLVHVRDRVAECTGRSVDAIAATTTRTAEDFFGLA